MGRVLARAKAYAPYADLIWVETGTPDLGLAREFATVSNLANLGVRALTPTPEWCQSIRAITKLRRLRLASLSVLRR